MQKATLPEEPTRNANNMAGNKETTRRLLADVAVKGKVVNVLSARFYMSRTADGASPVYCSVWISPRDGSEGFSGHGRATGYGYHKESAAFAAALDSAGVSLAENIDGVGDRAIDDAARAIVKACGYRGEARII